MGNDFHPQRKSSRDCNAGYIQAVLYGTSECPLLSYAITDNRCGGKTLLRVAFYDIHVWFNQAKSSDFILRETASNAASFSPFFGLFHVFRIDRCVFVQRSICI